MNVLSPLKEAPEYLLSLLNGRATNTSFDNCKSKYSLNALAVPLLSFVAKIVFETACEI